VAFIFELSNWQVSVFPGVPSRASWPGGAKAKTGSSLGSAAGGTDFMLIPRHDATPPEIAREAQPR